MRGRRLRGWRRRRRGDGKATRQRCQASQKRLADQDAGQEVIDGAVEFEDAEAHDRHDEAEDDLALTYFTGEVGGSVRMMKAKKRTACKSGARKMSATRPGSPK